MAESYVEDLESVIRPYLKSNQQIIDKNVTKLPQAGFGSIMLKVALTVKQDDGQEEIIHIVAKILPKSEMAREIFDVQVTFKKEVAFYNTILPTLEQFRKDNGLSGILDSFPKFYGARANMDEASTDVDENAVLIMENLFESGFQNIDRKIGFDLKGTEFILHDLAKFHGTIISLRLKQPWIFEKKIKVTCKGFEFPKDDFFTKPLKIIMQENPECAPYIDHVGKFVTMKTPPAKEPFASVVHCDLWVNNTMQRFENGKILANKFVDFQSYDYRSCTSDVFFFIFTSVNFDVLQDNVDHLFKYYHTSLIDTLKEFRIDLKDFSYKQFLEDIKIEVQYEYSHVLQFLAIIKGIQVFEEIENNTPEVPPEAVAGGIPVTVKEHMWFLTTECARRGWIQ